MHPDHVVTGRERITTADAEAIYGIPARTIRRWWAEGRITDPEIRHGRYWWLLSEIDQLAHQRHKSRLTRTPHLTRKPQTTHT